MNFTGKSKKKSKWYYRKCSQQSNTSSISLHVGLQGVLLTCNGNEGRAITEFYRLLDFTLDHLGISLATLASTQDQNQSNINSEPSTLPDNSCQQSAEDSCSGESSLSNDEEGTDSAEPKRPRLSSSKSSESVTVSAPASELDIAAAIQAEVETLQPAHTIRALKPQSERKPFEGRLYHQVKTRVKNVIFVRFSEKLAAAADPVALALRMFDLYRSPSPSGSSASAYGSVGSARGGSTHAIQATLPRVQQLCRVLPVQSTCHATLTALTAALERLFERLAVLSDEQLLNPPLAPPHVPHAAHIGDKDEEKDEKDEKEEKEKKEEKEVKEEKDKTEEPRRQESGFSPFRGPLTYLVLFEARNHTAFASTPKSPKPQKSLSKTSTSASASAEPEPSSNEDAKTATTGTGADSSAANISNSTAATNSGDQRQDTEDKSSSHSAGGACGDGVVVGEGERSEAAARREVTGLLRDDVLETVVQVVRMRRPGWRVSLDRPALAIGVQVLGASACIGLLPRYQSLAKYNVAQLQRVMLDAQSSS